MERVCVIGAGAIGSLFAGHLAAVADVSVLTRRRGARRGARIAKGCASAGAASATRRCARRPIPTSCRRSTSASSRRRRRASRARSTSLRGRFPDATIMTVLNGLGAEEAVRAARRLADHLGRHVHERHAPLGHARRVRPRHRDVARALRGHAVRGRRGGRRADRGRGPARRGAARPAARAVVEADLQRDRELRRGAHRPAARLALRGARATRPISAISSTT